MCDCGSVSFYTQTDLFWFACKCNEIKITLQVGNLIRMPYLFLPMLDENKNFIAVNLNLYSPSKIVLGSHTKN